MMMLLGRARLLPASHQETKNEDQGRMSGHQKHLQGLQIPGGALSEPSETRGWIAAFLVREAILLCPDDLAANEEAIYVNAIGNFVVSVSYTMLTTKQPFDPFVYRTNH